MIQNAVRFLKERIDTENIAAAFVLGSGLSFSEDEMTGVSTVDTAQIPGYPRSTVQGHSGTIITGYFGDKKIMILSGRVHYYEGYSIEQVVFPVRLVKSAGVEKIIMTNASGGISPGLKAGSIVLINSMTAPFFKQIKDVENTDISSELYNKMKKAAQRSSVKVHEGKYAYMTGPCFETPAEIDYLNKTGSDIVGMSTVAETAEALRLGMETAAVSRVANEAAGISSNKLSHLEVLQSAQDNDGSFKRFLKELILII